jgi:thiol-disulfide isomerase/thioredoxin
VVAALVTLAACGGESGPIAAPPDDTVAPPADDALDPTATTAGPVPTSPSSTVDSTVPSALVGYVRPVEITGDALPLLQVESVEADVARGSRAPIVAGEDFEGRTVRINGVAAGPTMVVFLAHWCPHCNDEIPVLNRLRDEGRFPEGLNIVAVSTAVNAGRPNFPPDRWLETKDWTYPVIADGIDFEREVFVASDAFGLNVFPFTVLIDGDGVVQARWGGGRSADEIIGLIEQNLTFG